MLEVIRGLEELPLDAWGDYDPGIEDMLGLNGPPDQVLAEEEARQARIEAGVEHACVGCGCSESRACPGGCVWATPNLCSRCAGVELVNG